MAWIVKVRFEKVVSGIWPIWPPHPPTGSRLRFNQASRLMNRDTGRGICKKIPSKYSAANPRGVVLSCYHNRELLFATDFHSLNANCFISLNPEYNGYSNWNWKCQCRNWGEGKYFRILVYILSPTQFVTGPGEGFKFYWNSWEYSSKSRIISS